MGTPAFAAHSLSLLAERHEVVEVFTQPDRPAGRGRKLQAPPVKLRAEELGLPVFQPTSVRDEESLSRVTSHAPDVIAVVGYGQFIPKRIRDLPPHGCVNVHSSLLPKYRGAAPVNWAIARGETRTGVTTIRLERELDAGDILMAREAEIGRHETASQLQVRLEPIGAELLIDTLAALEAGTLEPQPQDHAAATRAPLLRREDGLVDWSLTAEEIHNRMRGFDPWPGIFSFFRGQRLRILDARPHSFEGLEPGSVQLNGNQLLVGCGKGCLVLGGVQLEGRKRIAALDFARGSRLGSNEVLGNA